jgi:hypothetical protein
MDDRNLKFGDSDMAYDPTSPTAETAPGGQYAAILLSGWPWMIDGDSAPAAAANFDVDFILKEEVLPNLEAQAIMPTNFQAPKSPHDLSAIFSRVISGLGSVASCVAQDAIGDLAGRASIATRYPYSGISSMLVTHNLKNTKLALQIMRHNSKRRVMVHRQLGSLETRFHKKTGYDTSTCFGLYLHNAALSLEPTSPAPSASSSSTASSASYQLVEAPRRRP